MSQKLVIRMRLVETRLAVIYRKFNGLARISVCINTKKHIIKWNLFGFSQSTFGILNRFISKMLELSQNPSLFALKFCQLIHLDGLEGTRACGAITTPFYFWPY